MKTTQKKDRCPTCESPLPEGEKIPSFPFCSDRCRLVDLGKWLNEEYRIEDQDARN